MPRSGILKDKLQIWRKNVIKNEFGEYNEEWYLYYTIRAYIKKKSGREILTNDEVFDTVNLIIQIRNQIDITDMDNVKYKDKMYKVEFIQEDDTGRFLTIKASKINE